MTFKTLATANAPFSAKKSPTYTDGQNIVSGTGYLHGMWIHAGTPKQ